MTTRKPKPPPDASASKGWQQAAMRHFSEFQGPQPRPKDWRRLFDLNARIKPPEGWRPAVAEGFLIAEMAEPVELVRLSAVLERLAEAAPRSAVLRRCLGQLVDADHYPLCMFYVLDPDREPVRVLDRFHASTAAVTALGLPGVQPMSEPIEVAAWLLEAWWRVWPGHSDISQAIDRAQTIQQRRKEGHRLRLQALGLTESDVEDESVYWPADDVLLASLNRLALPVFVAFDLWGYGVDTSAPGAGVEVPTAISASNVVSLKPDDLPSDATNDAWWLEWCRKRIAANTKPDGTQNRGRACAPWTDDAVRVFGLRLSTLKVRGNAEAAAKTAIAHDLQVSVQAMRTPMKKLEALQSMESNHSARKGT